MENARSRQQLRATMRLRELVVAGAFTPGERISELAAVDMLGMSRTPVRLALGALAHEGLLERLPSGGFIVRDYSISDIYDAIELRGVLEGTAARMAAERSSGKKSTVKLRAILAMIDTLIEQDPRDDDVYERYVELNAEFHEELLRLAKCPLLERSLAQVTALPFASANAFVKVQANRPRSKDVLIHAQHQHIALVDAIEAGESARALSLGQEHARLAARNLTEVMKQDELFNRVPGAQLIRRQKDQEPARAN